MWTALVAGHICVDLIPELHGAAGVTPGRLTDVGPLSLEPGGSVANTGAALLALGAPARLAADVGDDDLGRLLLGLLAGRGLDVSALRVVPGATTSYSVVVQEPDRDRAFWHHTGANSHFDGHDLDVDGSDLLHIGYPSILPSLIAAGGVELRALLGRARDAGLTTSIDLAVIDPDSEAGHHDWAAILESSLPLTDVVTPSVEDLASALRRDFARGPDPLSRLAGELLEAGAAVVMVTAGPSGTVLRTASGERLHAGGRVLAALRRGWADRELWVPPLPAEIVRTTGAGDAATAGLLYGLLAGFDAEASLLTAAGAAALTLSGRRPLPPYAETGLERVEVTAPPPPGWRRGPRGIPRGPLDAGGP